MLLYADSIRYKIGWSEDWFILILMVQLVLLAWIIYNYWEKIGRLFSSVSNREIQRQEFEDQINWTNTYSIVFMLFYFINISWFLYLVLKYFNQFENYIGNKFLIFLMILVGFVLLYLLKLLLLNVINGLTPDEYGISEYGFSLSIYNQLTGLVIFPILIFLSYTPDLNKLLLLKIILGIAALLYFLQIIRGFINSYRSYGQPFYIILYLCTFEFLPILLVVKVVNL